MQILYLVSHLVVLTNKSLKVDTVQFGMEIDHKYTHKLYILKIMNMAMI
jgi:hypothetical protein